MVELCKHQVFFFYFDFIMKYSQKFRNELILLMTNI